MLREALVCALALTLLGSCDRPDWETREPPSAAMTPSAPATPKLVHPLGDLLPIAIYLDCSTVGTGERPASVYVTIQTPDLPTNLGLSARVDSDTLCETHDTASNPEAPPLAIRCPPRQVMEYDTGRYGCTHHYIQISVCSPGFVAATQTFADFSSCGMDREQLSCASLSAKDVTQYPLTLVVYAPKPAPADGGPSCGAAPAALLDDEPLFECPCFEE